MVNRELNHGKQGVKSWLNKGLNHGKQGVKSW